MTAVESRPEPAGLDALLERLERLIAALADPTAPIDRLVADYEEAGRVLLAAEARLAEAERRVARLAAEGGPAPPGGGPEDACAT